MKFLFFIIPLLILAGCSASTGTRYEKTEKKKETVKNEEKKSTETTTSEFDPYPYRENFDIKTPPDDKINSKDLDLFYTYDTDTSHSSQLKEVVDTVDGYRVQIIATDNLEEANQVRSEIYFKTNQKSLYVVFEPPFYKVKAGDFLSIGDAREFSFRLNQMGYKESKVVSEKVNVFK